MNPEGQMLKKFKMSLQNFLKELMNFQTFCAVFSLTFSTFFPKKKSGTVCGELPPVMERAFVSLSPGSDGKNPPQDGASSNLTNTVFLLHNFLSTS